MNQSLIRSILKIGAGFFVAKGYTDESNAEIIIAGLVALASVIWGVLHRSGEKSITPVPLIALFACFACFAGTASAAPVPDAASTIVIPDQLFRAGEVSLDFGTYARTKDFGTFQRGTLLDLNWLPWRAAGLFGEATIEDWNHSFIDTGGFGLTARLPVERLRLAPQFQLGAQFDFEHDGWSTFASAGLELRLTRGLGLVAEVRGVRPNDHRREEYLMGTIKLRGVFF